jgi:hypothetical protein
MAPIATLLYGFEVDNGMLPGRIRELTEEVDGYRQAIAAYLRGECGDLNTADLPEYDDHVSELESETGLLVAEWGVERFFVTTRRLHWYQYDIAYCTIGLEMPLESEKVNLRAIAGVLGSPPVLKWHLMADSD